MSDRTETQAAAFKGLYSAASEKLDAAVDSPFKLRDYQLALIKQIRETGDKIVLDYPFHGDRRSRVPAQSVVTEGEIAHLQFQRFAEALHDPALRKDAPKIVVDSYAAFDFETNPFRNNGRNDGVVFVSETRTGKSITTQRAMLDLKLFPTRRLAQNQVSRRNLFHPQLNDRLPPVSRMLRAVQSAIKEWSSK